MGGGESEVLRARTDEINKCCSGLKHCGWVCALKPPKQRRSAVTLMMSGAAFDEPSLEWHCYANLCVSATNTKVVPPTSAAHILLFASCFIITSFHH